jgi:hypothetical protein
LLVASAIGAVFGTKTAPKANVAKPEERPQRSENVPQQLSVVVRCFAALSAQ